MKKTSIFNLLIFITIFSLAVKIDKAYADDFSSGINPSVIKIEATSPSLIRAPISLENSSDQTITYSIFLRPFEANPELNGEPDFNPELNTQYQEFFKNVAITDQGKTISEITLSPHQRKDLTLLVQVSDETEERDYYFTAIFLSQADEADSRTSTVKNRGGIGTNVLVTIGGKKNPNGAISKFSMPTFLSKGPVEFELELANLSDYYVTSKGNLVIKNMFGQAVGNIEIDPTNILSNSNKIISTQDDKLVWNEKFLLGIYKADLNIAISDKGPLLNESKYFFALPVKELFIFIAILLILGWLFRTARKKNLSK